MAGDVIKQFVIGLDFKSDRSELDRAEHDATAAAKKVESKWKDAAKQIGAAFKGIAAATAGAVAGMVGFVEHVTGSTAELDAWAKRMGVTTQELQRLEHAGSKFGASSDHVREAIKTLRENLGELARVGSGPAIDSLASLGLTLEQLDGRSAEDQLGIIGDALGRLPDQAQRISVALELMGEDGGALLPMFAEGSAAIRAYGDEAERLGVVLGDDAVAGSVALQKEMKASKAEIGALAQAFATDLIPIVRQVVDGFMGVVRWFGESESAAVRATPAIAALGVAAYALAGPWGLVAAGIGLVIANLGRMQDAVTDAIGVMTGLNEELERMNGLSGGQTQIRGSLGLIEGEAMKADSQSVAEANVRRKMAGLSDADLGLLARKGRGRAKTLAQTQLDERRTVSTVERANEAMVRNAEGLAALGVPAAGSGAKGKGRGGRPRPADMILDEFDVQAGELFDAEFQRLGERSNATEQAIAAASEAAAASLRSGASTNVARQAGIGQLSSLTGYEFNPSQDRLLSEIFGEAGQPDVRLAELTQDTTPQVLNSNITNNFTTQVEIQVDGAGDPRAVAENVGDVFETRWTEKLNQTSKFVKILFDA